MELGPQTRRLLTEFGLDEDDLKGIETGEISWEVVDAHHPHPDVDGELLLFHNDFGQRFVCCLTKPQVEKLVNAWDFERRKGELPERPVSFPCGDLDDWAGISPDSDWVDLVKGYRQAVSTLAANTPRATAAPFLYLCRHLLELQLKAIVMLGQQAMGLVSDLPIHHDLQRLWTAAFPIAVKYHSDKDLGLGHVRGIIDDYHAADANSMSFRYPVTKNNKPVDHASHMFSFSRRGHATHLMAACDTLDAILLRLRLAVLFAGYTASGTKEDIAEGRTG